MAEHRAGVRGDEWDWSILDELWAHHSDLTEDEAMRLAYDELDAHRAERHAREEAAGDCVT